MKRKSKKSGLSWLIFFAVAIFGATLFFNAEKVREEEIIAQNHNSSSNTNSSRNIIAMSSSSSVKKAATFIIAGDAMFDRGVDYYFREDEIFNIFDNLDKKLFTEQDLAILNLEGPISSVPVAKDPDSGLVFNFPPKTVDALVYLGIDGVSLANNHTDNNGLKGYQNTVKVLNEAKIKPFGKQEVFDETAVARFETNGVKISFISIDVLATNADIRPTIRQEKNAGYFVFIMPHWGVEYKKIHHESQEYLAKKWIDAGADMIIGGHPHVVQDGDVYKGKPIFYSLGNFVFDQKWSAETQQGLIIKGKIENNILTVEPLPTISKNIKPELKTGNEKEAIVSLFRKNFNVEKGDIFTFSLKNEQTN